MSAGFTSCPIFQYSNCERSELGPMRIAFISTYPPIECGIGTYTCYLNEALKKLHNETFVASQIGAQGENVFPILSRESTSLGSELFSVCDKITPDVIHVQHEYGLYGSQKGVQIADFILRCKLAGEPVVTTLHTVHSDLEEFEKIILRTVVGESSAIIVHEGYQKETLVRYLGQDEKIHVIPHGVREVSPIPDAKEKLGIEGKKVILLCGYFRPTKGFSRVVEWFPEVCEMMDDVVLVIAGKSRGLEFRGYQRQFFEAINNSSVNDKIVVLRGQFPQHTFDTIVSASDVVVLPYDLGGQSGIMSQCFAFGKPVVTSNLLAFKIILEKCKGGFVCETKQDYLEKVATILNNTILAQSLRENINNYVDQKAGWSKIAQSHIKIYRSVVRVPYGKARYVQWDDNE